MPVPKYFSVIFWDWDGSRLSEQTVAESSSAIAPNDPSRDGYTFVGWDKSFNNITHHLDVYALYEESSGPIVETFTVVFKDYDGTILKTESVERGGSATAPSSPIREGYTFSGWDRSFTNVTSNITVNALYTKDGSGLGEDDEETCILHWILLGLALIMIIIWIIDANRSKKEEDKENYN